VELAIFAAGIDIGRQRAQQVVVEAPAGEAAIQLARIDRDEMGEEARSDHVGGQFACVTSPQREDSGHSGGREPFLAIGPDVLQEQVAEYDVPDTTGFDPVDRVSHARFVNLVRAWARERHFQARQTESLHLPVKDGGAHPVH